MARSKRRKLESCVQQVKSKGHKKSSAFAICNASLNRKKRRRKRRKRQ